MQRENLYIVGTGELHQLACENITNTSHPNPWEAQLPVQARALWTGSHGGQRSGSPCSAFHVSVSLCPSVSQKDQKQCSVPWILPHSTFPCTHPPPGLPRSAVGAGVWASTGRGQRELAHTAPSHISPSNHPLPSWLQGEKAPHQALWAGAPQPAPHQPNPAGMSAVRVQIKQNMPCPTHTLLV